MARQQQFKPTVWSEQFQASYARLSAERQRQCDGAIIALIKGESTPGLRIKPIKPDKYFLEARINDGTASSSGKRTVPCSSSTS